MANKTNDHLIVGLPNRRCHRNTISRARASVRQALESVSSMEVFSQVRWVMSASCAEYLHDATQQWIRSPSTGLSTIGKRLLFNLEAGHIVLVTYESGSRYPIVTCKHGISYQVYARARGGMKTSLFCPPQCGQCSIYCYPQRMMRSGASTVKGETPDNLYYFEHKGVRYYGRAINVHRRVHNKLSNGDKYDGYAEILGCVPQLRVVYSGLHLQVKKLEQFIKTTYTKGCEIPDGCIKHTEFLANHHPSIEEIVALFLAT